MKNLIFILLMGLVMPVSGQTVKGKVVMQGDGSPAQFASVGLFHLPDSGVTAGVITLSDGIYMFEKVKPGEYFVRVSFVGYSAGDQTVSVAEGSTEVLVDTIQLSEAVTNLDEVTVIGERLKGKELVDRTIYSIPPQAAKVSNNGYDLLKKIPQVNVDFQNNVTLNGSSNFIIQVDGRQRDKEFLAKLLPTDMESVEIISNPSGKYEGNIDGVINIILKKEARYGMNGNASLNLKPLNRLTAQASASLDYSTGKITYYVTAYTFSQNLKILNNATNRFILSDSTTSLKGDGDILVTSSSVNTGFDYYMNDRNNLSFNINYKPTRQNIDMESNTTLLKSDNPLETLNSLTTNNLQSNEGNVSLFYKKTFPKAIQEFTTDLNYYRFRSAEGNDFLNSRYPYDSEEILSTYSRLEDNLNDRDYFSAKLDYVQPLGLTAKLEFGYQAYYQKMFYDFTIDLDETENQFDYKEFRNSLYGGFTFNHKKFGFQSILRMEHSEIDADSVTQTGYTCLLPSANLQYKISSSHNLKLTYNRRINRPGIYDLNPYERIGQNYDVSQGNPNLKPEYRDRIQLTYTWNFGSNYFSPSVYYESLTNRISRQYNSIISPVDSSLTTFTKPYNLLDGYEIGAGINAMLWFVNINGRMYKGHFDEYKSATASIAARDYYSFAVTAYTFAPLNKKKTANAFAFLSYNGVNVDAQAKTYNLAFYGLGAQTQLKNHTVGFVWLLPLSRKVDLQRTETETPFYRMQNIIGFDVSYFVQVMYSYKFSKGKNVKKLDRKVEIESDSKSQGFGK